MTNWIHKCWGKTRLVSASSRFQQHELEVEAGGYCSWHYHETRENLFRVVSGRIKVAQLFGWRYSLTTLGVGDEMFVPAKVVHCFFVQQPGTVVEEYWPTVIRGEVKLTDIVRLTVGGKLEPHEDFETLLSEGFPQLEPLCKS